MSERGLAGLIRLHRWRIDQKRREVVEHEMARADCQRRLDLLTTQIKTEQTAADAPVVAYAYGDYVRVALAQRQGLIKALAAAEAALAAKRAELSAAFQDLKKFEVVQTRRQEEAALEQARRDQAVADEVGLRPSFDQNAASPR